MMPEFEAAFTLSTPITSQSAASMLTGSNVARAGVYERGLITILDKENGNNILDSWSWLLKDDAVALATTWQGDVIFWSPSKMACFFFDTQRAKSTIIDQNISVTFG